MKTSYAALEINYHSKSETWLSNTDVSIPITDTLAFTRSGSFFTSAIIIQGKTSPKLVMEEAHYERLVTSYGQLYERDLLLTKEAFQAYVQALITQNQKNGLNAPYQLLVYGLGGPTDNFGTYNSGLSGDIKRLVFVTNPLAVKPDWTFAKGLNLISIPAQRFLADAKPTNYVSGIKAQIAINAINAETLRRSSQSNGSDIETLSKQITIDYLSLSDAQKKEFRKSRTKFRVENAPFLQNEGNFYEHLLHESLFMTSDNYILEGPTFSILGITKNNELHLIPLDGNGKKTSDENDGKILHSTSIQCIKSAAKIGEFNIKTAPLHYADINTLKGLFAVSVTRVDFTSSSPRLQPIHSIDGHLLPKVEKDDPIQKQLSKNIATFLSKETF